MTTRVEMETVAAFSVADNIVRIYSSYAPHIRKMREDPAYVEIRGGKDFAEFEITTEHFDLIRARRHPRHLNADQRAALAARMVEVRASRRISVGNNQDPCTEVASDGSTHSGGGASL